MKIELIVAIVVVALLTGLVSRSLCACSGRKSARETTEKADFANPPPSAVEDGQYGQDD